MKLHNTRLLVNDFPKTFLFYRDVLGLTPAFGDENDVYTEFVTDGTILAIFQAPLMQEALTGTSEAAAVGAESSGEKFLLAFAVDDVDQIFADLSASGVTFVAEPKDRPVWGIRTAHLSDPEGNLIELFASLKV